MDDDATDDAGADPATAFALLGDETRIGIVQALADARDGFRPDPASFSELHDRVEGRDSARFNYHLQQLLGHFVEKVDGGYRLTYAGEKVVRAIRAGVYTGEPTLEPAPVEGTCAWCESSALVSEADGDWLRIRCSDCGEVLTANDFPPGGLQDRDRETVLAAFDRLVRHRVSFARDGICPECTGPMAGAVSASIPDPWGFEALPAYQCARCDFWVVPSFGMVLLDHPTVAAFYADHGIDVGERPYWDLPLCVSDRYTTVERRDPWDVVVAIERDGEKLTTRIRDDGDGIEVGDPVRQ